uniref:Large polyvalent protein associated domain-containing protein n=1 Tax=viral metagenome TaxID=1070528 RepID=A0A6M3K442_9ZZZZ
MTVYDSIAEKYIDKVKEIKGLFAPKPLPVAQTPFADYFKKKQKRDVIMFPEPIPLPEGGITKPLGWDVQRVSQGIPSRDTRTFGQMATPPANAVPSIDTWEQEYFASRGWTIPNLGALKPSEEDTVKQEYEQRMTEARKAYVDRYGMKEYLKSAGAKGLRTAGTLAAFIAAPAAGPVAAPLIQLGAAGAFGGATALDWGRMSDIDKVVNVAIDSLYAAHAIKGVAQLPVVRQIGKEAVRATMKTGLDGWIASQGRLNPTEQSRAFKFVMNLSGGAKNKVIEYATDTYMQRLRGVKAGVKINPSTIINEAVNEVSNKATALVPKFTATNTGVPGQTVPLAQMQQGMAMQVPTEPLRAVPATPAEAQPIVPQPQVTQPVAGQPTLPTGTAQPPVVPPPIKPVAGAAPAGGMPSGITNTLTQAKAIVQRDKPGLITRIMGIIPGIKQIQRAVHPSLGMKDSMLEGWIGQGSAQSTVSNALHSELFPAIERLNATFGEGATDGGKIKVQFTGTPAQSVPFNNTLYDVMQRAQLYNLTSEQRKVLQDIQTTNSGLLNKYRDLYGLEIGEFPTPEGTVHLPNVDSSKTGILMAGSEETALRRGRAKERFYETGADRYLHDKAALAKGNIKAEDVFTPNLNVGALLNADNETLAAMAGQNVFKTGLGGKNKLELLEATHPDLYAKMTELKRRLTSLRGTAGRLEVKQQKVIDDFLNSAYTDEDLTQFSVDLTPAVTRGKNVGKDITDINKELAGIKAQIIELRPAWRTANPRGYVFVQEGGLYRYFPAEDARQIRRLTQVSKSRFLKEVDNLRATAFGGDLSPATIQGLNGWLYDPVGVSKFIGKEIGLAASEHKFLRSFTTETLANDVRTNADSWQRFTLATGLNPLGGFQRQEFGTGWMAKIPKVGKYWEVANDAVYRPLIKIQKDAFDSIYNDGIKMGLTSEQSAAIAADDVTKIIPSYSYRRLGLSQAEAAHFRAGLTSVSFLTQPASFINDAVKGFVKLGTFQKATPTEHYAAKRVLTLMAIVSAISSISGALYAKRNKKDPVKAALAGVTPGDPYFWSLILPNGDRIGLGGPLRSLIRAVFPGKVKGVPVPLPFAGMPRFMLGKMHPAARIVYDEIRNKDYFGKTIRDGDFPINVLQGMEYVAEGAVPLTAGSAMEDIRRGEAERILPDVISQFAGVNLVPIDKIYNLRREWQKELDVYYAIPTNSAEIEAAKRKDRRVLDRSQYRQANPEIDAMLFIIGDTTALQPGKWSKYSSVVATLNLIRDNNIDPMKIDGVQKYLADDKKRAKLGLLSKSVTGEITPTDHLMKMLAAANPQLLSKPTPAPVSQPVAPQPTATQPTPVPESIIKQWGEISSMGGTPFLQATNKVWFNGGTLTPQEDKLLRDIFNKYPLGQSNFDIWLKQSLRYLFMATINK